MISYLEQCNKTRRSTLIINTNVSVKGNHWNVFKRTINLSTSWLFIDPPLSNGVIVTGMVKRFQTKEQRSTIDSPEINFTPKGQLRLQATRCVTVSREHNKNNTFKNDPQRDSMSNRLYVDMVFITNILLLHTVQHLAEIIKNLLLLTTRVWY